MSRPPPFFSPPRCLAVGFVGSLRVLGCRPIVSEGIVEYKTDHRTVGTIAGTLV